MFNLIDRKNYIIQSVIITDCNKGIGLDTALSFARTGYKVFATMRNPAAATALKQIMKDENLSMDIYALDVDSDDSVKIAMDGIMQWNLLSV